jgi:hypothetical protein
VIGDVRFHDRQQVRRDGYVTDAGIALGRSDDHLAVGAYHGAPNLDSGVLQVDVGAAQLGQFAESQTAPGGQQHQQTVALRPGYNERLELGKGQRFDLVDSLRVPSTADMAGVRDDQAVMLRMARMVRSSP